MQEWINAALARSHRDISNRVKCSLNATKYVQEKNDPAGSITKLIHAVITALNKNNASEVVKDKSTSNHLINKLCGKLEPPEFKELETHSRECCTNEQTSHIRFFLEKVGGIADKVAQGEAVQARLGRKRGRSARSSGLKPTKVPDERPPIPVKKQHFKKRQKGKGDKTLSTPCLNPKCTGIHKIRDCPTVVKAGFWQVSPNSSKRLSIARRL